MAVAPCACCSNAQATMEPRSAKLARLQAVRSSAPHVSHSALAALLRVAAKEGLPDIKDVSRYHVAEARDRVAFMDTPYGPLHQHIDVGGVKVETQHPAAAMCAFCGASRALSALMSETAGRLQPTPAEPWRILLYLDEISPGNQLAYKHRRKTWGIYWSILEFGAAALSDEDAHKYTHTHIYIYIYICCSPGAPGLQAPPSGA